ncbi:hypothetical protein ACFVH6_32670 [Spirillospora sp. NPDC127200]
MAATSVSHPVFCFTEPPRDAARTATAKGIVTMSETNSPGPGRLGVRTAVVLLIGLVIGVTAGGLVFLPRNDWAGAITAGAAAFIGGSIFTDWILKRD